MIDNTISISFDKNTVILNSEVEIDIGMIRRVIFDRDKNIGIIFLSDNGPQQQFQISLKATYALIVFLGTSSWVNL